MNEELIVSGRMNPYIDPHLNIWHWQIPSYLFLGGLAAGILFFAALFYILRKEEDFPATVKWAPMITPFLLILGLAALFIDLNHKLYFWRLYTTVKLQSPMSWGAWTLMVITPLSIIWPAIYLKKAFPNMNWGNKYFAVFLKLFFVVDNRQDHNWEWKGWLKNIEAFFIRYKSIVAWIILLYAIILGIYTGILLSAFNARPLWNTSILGPLFLTSGLSTGVAAIMLMSRNHLERKTLSKIDLGLIGLELFFIIHMFMGFLASTEVQIEAANLFLGGQYTIPFWIFVVSLGLVLPAILEIMELKKFHIPVWLPPCLVLMGGIFLRFIIVYAGQASRYLY
jgi:formate-dependent nitrite reductase membrane component NrfD